MLAERRSVLFEGVGVLTAAIGGFFAYLGAEEQDAQIKQEWNFAALFFGGAVVLLFFVLQVRQIYWATALIDITLLIFIYVYILRRRMRLWAGESWWRNGIELVLIFAAFWLGFFFEGGLAR